MKGEHVSLKYHADGVLKFEYHEGPSGITVSKYYDESLFVVMIPDMIDGKAVTKIGDYCFSGHNDIEQIILPQGVTDIGRGAFANCVTLQNIYLPDSVRTIGAYAFQDCKSLSSISLPPLVEVLEQGMFAYCYGIHELHLPSHLRTIKALAFLHSGLRKLKLPKTVTDIEAGAFCGGLAEIITDLPIDEAWFALWPYNEKVIHDKFGIGIIKDYRGDTSSLWLEITVSFGETNKKFFLPNDLAHGLRFEDVGSQELVLKRYSTPPEECKKQYVQWGRGML